MFNAYHEVAEILKVAVIDSKYGTFPWHIESRQKIL
jgi:hypothetical protein